MGLALQVESRPESDPQHTYITCVHDNKRYSLIVCKNKCAKKGNEYCFNFWHMLVCLGIDSEDI